MQPRIKSTTVKSKTAGDLKEKLFSFQNVGKIYYGISQMSKTDSNFLKNPKLDTKNNLSAISREDYNK